MPPIGHTGMGSKSIFCNGCKHWVHKKCSWLKCLTKDPDYRCTWCQRTASPLDSRPQREVQVWPDKLEMVASFCYLGDMLSAASGCELSTTTHVKTAWKKFKELLPVLSSRHLSFKACGRVYSSCVLSAICGPGRSKMTWKQLTERDCREWKLLAINPHDRHTWRSCVRFAIRAACQLPGRGPTDVDVAPVPAC